jgi:hypothetical protein
VIAPVLIPDSDLHITHTLTARGFGWATLSRPGQDPLTVRADYSPASGRLFIALPEPDALWIDAATGDVAVWVDGQPFRYTPIPAGAERFTPAHPVTGATTP